MKKIIALLMTPLIIFLIIAMVVVMMAASIVKTQQDEQNNQLALTAAMEEEEGDENDAGIEAVDFSLDIKGGKATMNVSGTGWSVKDATGKAHGDKWDAHHHSKKSKGKKTMPVSGYFNIPAFGNKAAKSVKRKNAVQIYQALRKKGISHNGACALLGWWTYESSLEPGTENQAEKSGHASYSGANGAGYGIGIVQWSNSRHFNLLKYANSKHKKWTDIDLQMDFFFHEVTHGYKGVLSKLKTNIALDDAMYGPVFDYEGADKPGIPARIKAAEMFSKWMKGVDFVTGELDVDGTVKVEKGKKKNTYYVSFMGTLDGSDIAGGTEISSSDYNKYKRTGELSVHGSGEYGDGAAWSVDGGEGVQGALAYAKKICDDNDYIYVNGYGGCHACHPSDRKAYVCTTFVRAAYAHGAKDPEVEKWCKARSYGMVSDWEAALTRSSHWKRLGAIPQSSMKPGDVIIWGNHHTEMYYGQGKRIGAHNHDTYNDADSISVRPMYGGYSNVFRYKG